MKSLSSAASRSHTEQGKITFNCLDADLRAMHSLATRVPQQGQQGGILVWKEDQQQQQQQQQQQMTAAFCMMV
jgi:hypothetical protein